MRHTDPMLYVGLGALLVVCGSLVWIVRILDRDEPPYVDEFDWQ